MKGKVFFMKKLMSLVIAAVFMVGSATSAMATEPVVIDTSRATQGVVSVQLTTPVTKTTKVRIEKESQIYDYNLPNNDVATFPLQSGAGTYKITVAENVSGTTYRVVKTQSVTVDYLDDRQVFTKSIQLINFNGQMVSIAELNGLVANMTTDKEKIQTIYKYIVSNFKYDLNKVEEVTTNSAYIPVLDRVYAAKKGICYDYASLFAAILRANNIPTKLDMGYFTQVNAYHAWNEVLVDGTWMIIDTTYDSQALEHKLSFSMLKDNKEFKVVKQY